MIKTISEIVKEELELVNKATVWIKTRSIRNDRVKINQLASSLRVNIPGTIEVLRAVIASYQWNSIPTLGEDFKIFVIGTQVPDWLRDLLTKSEIAAVLSEAKLNTPHPIEDRLHRRALCLKYGEAFYDTVTSLYRYNEQVVLNALTLAEIDIIPDTLHDYAHLDTLNDHACICDLRNFAGDRKIRYNLKDKTSVILSFGARCYDEVDGEYPTKDIVMVGAQGIEKYSAGQLVEYLRKVDLLVRCVDQYGLKLVKCSTAYSYTMDTRQAKLVFASNHEVGDTVTVILPWTDVLFKIK